ncbi:protein STICHEL-like 2 [Phalaenopsis equestris]|uniref:protein STICHEL-like 2 n=1 Tax=Phalaenopsis equestris TaxID=78828 RepID=UPI0009E55B6C|nr:protein STICHEL-like 2 [Phalaenopsis equestris]XP_020573188.1 protein STICHEL-like 2 [Phalaenopsis equestris]XP_020573189.1 protein STICHEL-like 2 [Phalaenopsis equestris]XP_020573190.1 protein STICHEL-like 2 [Phalaenopsis equestris]XP_020573191.1 protein STICHEL-like 2 [Phalaenopsis equestris]
MDEGRRHSVDATISKALVTLKRVRSLRDPSTNSMSKFATAFDSVNWEVNSSSGTYVDFDKLDRNRPRSNSGLEHISKVIDKKNTTSKKSSITRIKNSQSELAMAVPQSLLDGNKKPLEHVRATSNQLEEEVDSCSETNLDVLEEISRSRVKKPGYGGGRRTSNVMDDLGMREVGSPCLSICGYHTNLSSRSTMGLSNIDDAVVVNSNYGGCGISYCWSRTPKRKDSTLSFGIEGQELPLLSAELKDRADGDIALIPESAKSLSQKFQPRSFNELVGLNVVTESLMHSIKKGRVAPFYLFHGPRGTGKTSTARIFAAALNCLSVADHRPCGSCQECVFLFSGRSRDAKELCATKLNHKDRIKALLKGASLVPFTSQFRVFIIEECHFLRGEIWSAILNNVEELSRHTVFVMITSKPDSLHHTSMSLCQRYHFPRIKEDDIICRLQKICMEEGFIIDEDALTFISNRANGSLQDAETMLDQLALLGKKITLSLAHELIGITSDEDLLDLLDLALSADTSNTVRRARDLMMSRIDPMQLISQLANLIMDILSGKCQSEFTNSSRKFLGKHAMTQAGIQKLRHALKILSETEKQLRTSTNQATWLTVALLQFGAQEPSLTDVHESMECSKVTLLSDCEALDSYSAKTIQKQFICYGCNKQNCPGRHCNRAKLETIWRRAMTVFQSGKLRSFLRKEGNLSALHFSEGLAIATIDFNHPEHVRKAEKSWKSIASSFQNILGCYVEIRIKLLSACYKKNRKSFSLLSCSGRKQENSEASIIEKCTIETPTQNDFIDKRCSSDHDIRFSPQINLLEETAQSNSSKKPTQSIQMPKVCNSELNSSRTVEEVACDGIDEAEIRPNCFTGILERQKRLLSTGASHIICLNICSGGKSDFSMSKKGVDKAYFLAYDPYNLTPASNALITYKSEEDRMRSKYTSFRSRLFCWRSPILSPRLNGGK